MKPESLHALLIDRELAELAPDSLELLEAWLAEHPESAASAASLRRTLETTSAAVRRFPELARPEPNLIAFPAARFRLVPLALAASILLLLGGAAWLGYRAGQQSPLKTAANRDTESATAPQPSVVKRDGPWARYALASNPRGGLTIVRRDNP